MLINNLSDVDLSLFLAFVKRNVIYPLLESFFAELSRLMWLYEYLLFQNKCEHLTFHREIFPGCKAT
jgi:hypothetical protein